MGLHTGNRRHQIREQSGTVALCACRRRRRKMQIIRCSDGWLCAATDFAISPTNSPPAHHQRDRVEIHGGCGGGSTPTRVLPTQHYTRSEPNPRSSRRQKPPPATTNISTVTIHSSDTARARSVKAVRPFAPVVRCARLRSSSCISTIILHRKNIFRSLSSVRLYLYRTLINYICQ